MPNFYCEKCGSINLVPPEATHFTCKICHTEQLTPAHTESVEDTSLNNMVLEPEQVNKANNDSLFNRFASLENVRVYDENDADNPKRDETVSKEGIYYTALSKMGGEDPELYQEALNMLRFLKGFKDADDLAEECRQKIESLKAEEDNRTQAQKKRRKKRKILLAIAIPSVVLLVAAILFIIFIQIPQSRYNQAIAAAQSGDTVTAYEIFTDLKGYKDSPAQAKALFEDYKTEKMQTAAVGDTVYFGTYEQDDKKANGKEDILWTVLEKKDDAVLLLSVYGLDCQPYHNKNEAVTWETSNIREWLNDAFLLDAFTNEQQEKILTTDVKAHKNPDFETSPGNSTKDKVFLLSTEEAEQYLKTDEQCRCIPTTYAISHGVSCGTKKYAGHNTCTWFLRTPGLDATMAGYVSSAGKIRHVGYSVTTVFVGVRPAIWIKK